MLLLDVTVVNVALPDIQSDLDASFSSLQWVIDAYALTLASFLLVAGSLGDRLGRRRVFSFGFALFTVASFACGISGDATLLNLARGLQGAGAAAMFATALALIAQEFEGRERANAIGIWGATVGGAVAIGPLVGGLITEHLGWEWIFFVNVPIGIAAIVLTETKLANVKATDPQPIDWPGLATFSAGLFLLIFGLIRGNPEGWGSATIVASLGAAVLLLVAFLVIESRRENAMLDLSLFRKPSFTGVSIVAFALSAGMFAMFLYLTLYIQGVLGYSPLEAGLRFLPLTVLSFFVAPIAGRLAEPHPGAGDHGHGADPGRARAAAHARDRRRRRLDDPARRLGGRRDRDRDDQPGHRLGRDRGRHAARAGMASGINSTFRQVGIATGIAALGAIFQSQISSKLSELLPQAPSAFSEAVSSGAAQSALASVPPQFRAQAADAANTAFISGLNEILLVGAAIALVGGIAAWALVRGRDMVAVPGAAPPAVPTRPAPSRRRPAERPGGESVGARR